MTGLWLVVAALLAAGLGALEYRRPRRARRFARVTAVVGAVAALAVLWQAPGEHRAVTLLTPGAPLAAHSREALSLADVGSPGSLLRDATVRLVGWGLLAHEWPTGMIPAGFDRAPLPGGVVALDAANEIGLGQRYTVTGALSLAGSDSSWVILDDPGGARDSARVSAASPTFSLSDRPRAEGPSTYLLRIRGAGGRTQAETLAVAVRPVTPASVLVLDASPSFETAFLKRWLGDRGARVTLRTTISRGKHRIERLNGAPDVNSLTPAVLARFDAVLADGGSLLELSDAECQALDRAVTVQGLGLLISADAGLLTGNERRGPALLEPIRRALLPMKDAKEVRTVRPSWPDAGRRSPVAVEMEPLGLGPGLEVLARDQSDRPVAGRRQSGMGQVAVTLLKSPSRWVLEGDGDVFASYWYTMLAAVARDTLTRVAFQADGPLRPDRPMTVTLLDPAPDAETLPAAARSTPLVRIAAPAPGGEEDTVAMARDAFDRRRWTGRYWPRSAGWHAVLLGAGRRVPFRVTHPGEWTGLEAAARLSATTARSGAASASGRAPSPAGWRLAAFLILVVLLTALWVERRLPG